MSLHIAPTQEQGFWITQKREDLEKLNKNSCLCTKSGGVDTLLEQWIETNLYKISNSSQSEEQSLSPANNPQPL